MYFKILKAAIFFSVAIHSYRTKNTLYLFRNKKTNKLTNKLKNKQTNKQTN